MTDNNFIFDLITCHICPVKDIRCDIFNDYVAKKIAKGVISTTKDTFVIPRLGVLVTNRCNLSCKGCINSLHNSKGKIDLPPEEIVADLTKICDATDLISKVVIVGGEAFIHPDMYAILEAILKLPKIGIVQVITPEVQVLIQLDLQQGVFALSAVAVGTAMSPTAGLPIAARSTRATAASAADSVFAWT